MIATLMLPLLLQSASPAEEEMREALEAAAQSQPPEWNCADPQYQQEMNWCAGKEYEAADAELNSQWKVTADAMKARDADFTKYGGIQYDDRPGFFDTLLEAQRAWIAYRDAHCRSEGYFARGGSLEPLLVSTCKTALTQERTRQLRELAENY